MTKRPNLQPCMHGPTENPCAESAQWHLRVKEPEGFVYLMDCQKHFLWWLQQRDDNEIELDYHMIKPECDLPDAHWHDSTLINGDGCCSLGWKGLEKALSEPLVAIA
jgi:hypothetical protein